MNHKIHQQTPVLEIYFKKLVEEGVVTKDAFEVCLTTLSVVAIPFGAHYRMKSISMKMY